VRRAHRALTSGQRQWILVVEHQHPKAASEFPRHRPASPRPDTFAGKGV